MDVLYIGPNNYGSTTRMRLESLRKIMPESKIDVIDTSIPSTSTPKILQSIGWRFKIGPFIDNINQFTLLQLRSHKNYDLAWIDKGVFLKSDTVRQIKNKSAILVHYTPDPAFKYHRSRLFFDAIPYYEYCITTKSFEIDEYQRNGARNVLYSTQGYDTQIHKSYHHFSEKEKAVSFVGHHERNREDILQDILDAGIVIKLAGIKWDRFVRRNAGNSKLMYLGPGIYGEDYGRLLSSCYFSLGLLSKWIPELHTTRTLEIPACGTALITEHNVDTSTIFKEDEVLFFGHPSEITKLILSSLQNENSIEKLSMLGKQRVNKDGYDYLSLLKNLIKKIIN